MRWTGVDEFGRWLNQMPGLVADDVEAALLVEGEQIMAVSKKDTPVDTGNLRASGHVKRPKTAGGKTSVTLAYGTDYAVYVHEILTSNHPVGKAKYLEDPVKAAMPEMVGRLKTTIRRRLERRSAL